ncbi:hypothetical protein Agabi119p4_2337 [Agaricus bisporus var. burnettii]|uniref:NACHT domain-containing protein n=1 Tax=Agaricus bisporus var. burnettii TaxID=192524 RepID=A0A8H7F8U7_AGABI|nr:hypothetical protein Agabi119p4_2337 [Agaricus bisporus var. burnettii]
MKSWFKFENVQDFFSKMFGRTKHKPPMAQFAGHRERDIMKNTPLNIIVVSEVSEATDRDTSTTGMGNARSDALNYSTISTMVIDNPRHNIAHTIVGSEHEACQVDTITMGGFLNNPHHFVVRDSMLVDNSTNIIHHKVDHKAEKAKKQLSKHMIRGAAHDSSARDPPPKCHPGTRIKIHERIMAWFYDEIKHDLLLWIYGPAGVGKSAIVQTLAEVLASAGCLGASVFFSRPSARNYSHSVFITVAYQLAVHIEPYCSFICELLAFDPEVVNKSMEEQFRAFIVEPFVQKNIGKGGKPLGILLDGLDELDHQHQQQKIIHLITGFVQNHPEVPLVWVISSRPEPHITNTFKQQRLVCYYKEEYVPIDSPEACQDVERYLRNSFETIQKVNFPHIVHTGWPEEKKMVKLAHAALGLFAFADVAIRFVGDPNHVDPVTRLGDVLSVIDGSRVGSADDQPFAHLDALYTCILSRIPSKMWPITQRVLAAVPEVAHLSYNLRCVKGLSVILGLELSKVYASINDLYSLLDVPPLGDVYSRKLHFHHASFLDFLRDATRSKKFYTSSWTAKRDFRESGVRIWQDFKRQSSAGPNCGDEWSTYTSQFHSGANFRREPDSHQSTNIMSWD